VKVTKIRIIVTPAMRKGWQSMVRSASLFELVDLATSQIRVNANRYIKRLAHIELKRRIG